MDSKATPEIKSCSGFGTNAVWQREVNPGGFESLPVPPDQPRPQPASALSRKEGVLERHTGLQLCHSHLVWKSLSETEAGNPQAGSKD